MIQDVLLTREKHIGLITLNRPRALNALTLPMIVAMQHQLEVWQADASIYAVVVRAAAGKAFCAGGDVRWLYDTGLAQEPQQLEFFKHEYRLNQCIHDYAKPYIALMDGVTMGGGVGISLHGSHPVASERFVFAMPETAIGFFPDVGASYLLARCPDHTDIYLGLTGNRLNAREALELGLVKHVIASDDFAQVLQALLAADLSGDSYARVFDCLSKFVMPELTSPISTSRKRIDESFQHDHMEDIVAALQHQDDDWSRDTYANLKQKSPLSLKVTLKQLQEAAKLPLAGCLSMDYGLVQHFMQDHDFYEGVRAVLVDKDRSPHWRPEKLADVSSEMVARYFI